VAVTPMEKHRQHKWFGSAISLLPAAVLLCAVCLSCGFHIHALAQTQSYGIKEYNQLIEEDPNNYYLFVARGSKFIDAEQWDEAIGDYLAALALVDEGIEPPYQVPGIGKDGVCALVLMRLGDAYSSLQDYAAAIRYYTRLIDDKAIFQKLYVLQQMDVRCGMGYAQVMLGNHQGALAYYQANLLEEDVVKNPDEDKAYYYINSANNAQALLYGPNNTAMNGYLLNKADYLAVWRMLDAGSLEPFLKPVDEREGYLQGTLYLSTGLYVKAAETFSKVLDGGFEPALGVDHNTLRASCLIGLGKASYMRQEDPAKEAMAYFDKAQPLMEHLTYDRLGDYLFWKGLIHNAMDDAQAYRDCMNSIVVNPGITSLIDDISLFYVEEANKRLKQ
jgi:tetratricopeptide (TPR) repeat protein